MKKKLLSVLRGVLMAAAIMAVSILLAMWMKPLNSEAGRSMSFGTYLLWLAAAMAVMYPLEIALHEAGHLVFGLLSGYGFVSYRLGSLMLTRQKDRLVFKRYSLAGTLGQCLMSPPDWNGGRVPYFLYNMGGVFMNLISAGAFALLWTALRARPGASLMLFFGIYFALIMALLNGVPLSTATVTNDGWNALFIGKDPAALRGFWVMLKVNALQSEGVRLRDMPEEWFVFPDRDQLGNGMTAAMGVFCANRSMDRLDLAAARGQIDALLDESCGAAGLYKSLLRCDKAFLELLEKGPEADVSDLQDKKMVQFLRQMKSFPSVLRTQYALALLHERDEKKAAEVLDRFEKMAKAYPAPADIESERELLALAGERYGAD